jgi:hypothetical protein
VYPTASPAPTCQAPVHPRPQISGPTPTYRFDKRRSWAIFGQESTKSPTSGERDFLCQRSITFR